MSVAILKSRAQFGITAPDVTIEVFLSGGLPTFSIVGLAETAVRESKDRVRAAIQSSSFSFPQERIIVNLGPADMRKSGGRFDLAVALGILAAHGQVPIEVVAGFEFYGELALDGAVRAVPGVLPAALQARACGRPVFVPEQNIDEALLAGAEVYAASSLLQVAAHLNGEQQLTAQPAKEQTDKGVGHYPDLSDVRGQQKARRALEVAAAGGHNILFCGPPGTGKSMLAQRLPGILPTASREESIETAAVDSILGRPIDLANWRRRPFRSPHHTASAAALVGGGSNPRPGEISRAHNGVLFLDELPEFSRHVLEVLREPMEAGRIVISRASQQAEFPARFQLVSAMNPCPCGYLGDPQASCNCSADKVANYRGRISGPLLDRIDIQVTVSRPPKELLRPDAPAAESTAAVRRRVEDARQLQTERSGFSNAMLEGHELQRVCDASPESWQLLEGAMDRFALSARVHQRVWRVSRTIADLAGVQRITDQHVAEALSMRFLDRTMAFG